MKKNFILAVSVTKKLTMGIAGLFLMLFLIVHLMTNLLMLYPDKGKNFQEAVDFMTTEPLIRAFEIVLILAILIHIAIGITLKIHNWFARPTKYKVASRSESSFFGRYMIWTGLLIGTFLLIHFMHFFFVRLGIVSIPEGVAGRHNFYDMAVILFSNAWYSWIYIVLILLMGFHLFHAFQSLFQTLGFQHSKYYKAIRLIARLYAIIITLGFISIPVYFLYFYQ